MKEKILIGLAIITSAILIVSACKDNTKSPSDNVWANTEWTFLDKEPIKFLKPNSLKRSSRYRIKEDIPLLEFDTSRLSIMQKSLELMEFRDSEIDVFVDTTTTFGLTLIMNAGRQEFSKTMILMLKDSYAKQYQNMEMFNNHIQISELEVSSKQNQNHKMIKFATLVSDSRIPEKWFQTVYFLVGDAYTLMVYELTDSPHHIEKYLWTTKME